MSYERDEAMRQQEATEAMIRMREPRSTGPHPDPLVEECETGARALFRQHYQREPDSRDLSGLEMATYRTIAATVLMAVRRP